MLPLPAGGPADAPKSPPSLLGDSRLPKFKPATLATIRVVLFDFLHRAKVALGLMLHPRMCMTVIGGRRLGKSPIQRTATSVFGRPIVYSWVPLCQKGLAMDSSGPGQEIKSRRKIGRMGPNKT